MSKDKPEKAKSLESWIGDAPRFMLQAIDFIT